MKLTAIPHIAFIGFGEVGGVLGAALAAAGPDIVAYDVLLDDTAQRDWMRGKILTASVRPAKDLGDALAGADLVFSAVTPASAQQAAHSAGRLMRSGQTFIDLNSVSPATKCYDQTQIEASGAAYVEAAVMAPVSALGLRVPMLLGGITAYTLAEKLITLGMNVKPVATDIGKVSAIKMCRSVMIKGLEALTVECLKAARAYGAEDAVLSSLDETFPNMGWRAELPDYLISRVAEHGRRRAAEMREVAATLREAHIDPLMTDACARVQDEFTTTVMRYDKEHAFHWRDALDMLTMGKR